MYTALKPIKVQNADRVIEVRQPGQAVPEAAEWPNAEIWVKRGFLQLDDDQKTAPRYDRSKLKPAIPATPADVERAKAPVPMPGEELPGYKGQSDVVTKEIPTPAPTGANGVTKDQLMELSRDQLDELADEAGVKKPDKMKDKGKVADAILKAHAG